LPAGFSPYWWSLVEKHFNFLVSAIRWL
jgi:hypothetical protein